MRLVAFLAVLGACGGRRPPQQPPEPPAPWLFEPAAKTDRIEIDFDALEAARFRFALDSHSITPHLVRDPLQDGTLVRGTFGATGTVALARVGQMVTGVVREGSIGFEIVALPGGGHRIVRRSWAGPLRPRHGPGWDQLWAARGEAPTLVSDEPVTIDVLFAYTPAVLEARPLDGIKGLAAKGISDLNTACAKDCSNVEFRVAGVVPTTDTELAEDGTKKDMLALYYDLLMALRFKDAHAAREAAHADILVLLVDSVHGALGYGTIMGKPDTAVAVLDHHDSQWYLTIPHEIGHIMGALHDDDNRIKPFEFGHAYCVEGHDRTIMSNPCKDPPNCPLVTRWSAPPLGDLARRDNARVMRTTAKEVSLFRSAP